MIIQPCARASLSQRCHDGQSLTGCNGCAGHQPYIRVSYALYRVGIGSRLPPSRPQIQRRFVLLDNVPQHCDFPSFDLGKRYTSESSWGYPLSSHTCPPRALCSSRSSRHWGVPGHGRLLAPIYSTDKWQFIYVQVSRVTYAGGVYYMGRHRRPLFDVRGDNAQYGQSRDFWFPRTLSKHKVIHRYKESLYDRLNFLM